MESALQEIVVLDLSRVLAGPYASQLLGDMGARVIKVEQPGQGDDTRRWGPPFTANGESAYFFCANRNKESMTLNLKSPEGRAVLQELLVRTDILIENFKVGTMARFGLDYASLHERQPGLIYCSITGYGQTGPFAAYPGYDTAIQAQGGIMSITGPAGDQGQPCKVGVAIADITTGLNAAVAILAALHHRTVTGQGQYIDIALFDTQLSWLANVATAHLISGDVPRRYGNSHAAIVPYQTVPTADGRLMLAVGNDRQFAGLCAALGKPDWSADPRFSTNPQRVAHRETLMARLEAEFVQQATAHWLALLPDNGVPCGPVNDIPTALNHPQARARAMVQTIDHPVTGKIGVLGPVPKMSVTPAAIRLPPPLLGEHTDQILHDMLGYDGDRIARLRDAGAI